jgi:Flp pilus assembly protein TadD
MTEIEQAKALMLNGNFLAAKEILKEVLIDKPDLLPAICDIGIAFTETGENLKAVKALNHYVLKDKNNPHAWEALGCAWFRLKNYSKAREYLEKSLEILPENPSTLRNLGVLYGIIGHREQGYALLKRAAVLNPEDYRTLYALTYVHQEFGEREEAIRTTGSLLKRKIPDDIRKEMILRSIIFQLNWE